MLLKLICGLNSCINIFIKIGCVQDYPLVPLTELKTVIIIVMHWSAFGGRTPPRPARERSADF